MVQSLFTKVVFGRMRPLAVVKESSIYLRAQPFLGASGDLPLESKYCQVLEKDLVLSYVRTQNFSNERKGSHTEACAPCWASLTSRAPVLQRTGLRRVSGVTMCQPVKLRVAICTILGQSNLEVASCSTEKFAVADCSCS